MKNIKLSFIVAVVYIFTEILSPPVAVAGDQFQYFEALAPGTIFETGSLRGKNAESHSPLWKKIRNWFPKGMFISFSLVTLMIPKTAQAEIKEQEMMLKYLEASTLTKKSKKSYERDSQVISDREKAKLPEFRLGAKGGVFLASNTGEEDEEGENSFGGSSSASLLFPASGMLLETSFDQTYNKGSVLRFGIFQNILRDGPFAGSNKVVFEYERAMTERQKTQIYNSIEIIDGLSEIRLAFWQYQSYSEILDETRNVSKEIDNIFAFEEHKIKYGESSESELMRVRLKKIELERFVLQLKGKRFQLLKWLSVKVGTPLKISDMQDVNLVSLKPHHILGSEWTEWVDQRLDPSSRLRKLLIQQQSDFRKLTENISMPELKVGVVAEKTFNPGSGQITGSDFIGLSLSFSPTVRRSAQKRTQELEQNVRELEALESYRNLKAEVLKLIEARKNAVERLKKINESFSHMEKRIELIVYRYKKGIGSDTRSKEPLEVWFEFLNLKKELIDLYYQIHSMEIEIDRMTGYVTERFPILKASVHTQSA